jgi:hypothetical protein
MTLVRKTRASVWPMGAQVRRDMEGAGGTSDWQSVCLRSVCVGLVGGTEQRGGGDDTAVQVCVDDGFAYRVHSQIVCVSIFCCCWCCGQQYCR